MLAHTNCCLHQCTIKPSAVALRVSRPHPAVHSTTGQGSVSCCRAQGSGDGPGSGGEAARPRSTPPARPETPPRPRRETNSNRAPVSVSSSSRRQPVKQLQPGSAGATDAAAAAGKSGRQRKTGQAEAQHTRPRQSSPQQQGRSQGGSTAASRKPGSGQQGRGKAGVNSRLLTAKLKAAASPEQLLQLVQQHAAAFDHIHLSAACTQAARVCRQGVALHLQPAAVQHLLSKLHQLAAQPSLQQQCGARQLANIIHSCSKLRMPYTARLLLPLFLQPSRLQQAEPQGVSNVLWAAATLQLELTAVQLQQLLGRLTAVLSNATPQAVSNSLWAVATMGQQVEGQQLQQLLGRLTAVLSEAGPQEVSNSLWAVATMGQQVQGHQLQQLLGRLTAVLSAAKPQNVSNSLWAVATMGQQVPAQQLQQLLGRLTAVLSDAKPQHVSNTLWAVATMGQQVNGGQLQQLLGRLTAVLPEAKLQAVSNSLWAVATMGQQVPQEQLQRLLGRFTAVLSEANPQHVSSTLWAVATMGQQVPQEQLQRLLERLTAVLADATSQTVSNTLWACGKLQHRPLQLLQALQQLTPERLHKLLAEADSQALANTAWACGQLGYRGPQLPGVLLQQAVQLLQGEGASSFTAKACCNLCWPAAALDLQQCVPQVLQLAAAAGQDFSTASDHNRRQLHQVHLWLLDSQLPAPGQGLSGVLTQQQLEQCRASWEQFLFSRAKQQPSRLQQSVYAAVQQLPRNTWQQQPQSEQPTDDKACLVDIAAVTTAGVKMAVEVDGPDHFVQPGSTLTGATQARNRALAARGYAVISIPYWEWNALRNKQQQQQYPLARLQAVAG